MALGAAGSAAPAPLWGNPPPTAAPPAFAPPAFAQRSTGFGVPPAPNARPLVGGATPSGQPFRKDAEVVPRIAARIVDMLLVGVITTLVITAFGEFSIRGTVRPRASTSAAFGWTLFVLGIAFTLYEPVMLAWRGQTLGKMLAGVEVEPESGPMSFMRAVRRHSISMLGRVLWIWSAMLFALDPLVDNRYDTVVKNASADALSTFSIIVMLAVLGLNVVSLVANGRSFYDRCGGTRVIESQDATSAPLRQLLDRF